MKNKHSFIAPLFVGLILAIASPAAAKGGHNEADHSNHKDPSDRNGHGYGHTGKPGKPIKPGKPGKPEKPNAVPELGAQGAGSAALIVFAGAAVLLDRRRRLAVA